jgi:hypothetical protein
MEQVPAMGDYGPYILNGITGHLVWAISLAEF